jgi:hypothetical protein
MKPAFVAKITLYPTEQGGRRAAIKGDWFGCPCKFDEKDFTAWDCRILLQGEQMYPGETKQFGMVFLTPQAGDLFRMVEKFYLWEGGIMGEATARLER